MRMARFRFACANGAHGDARGRLPRKTAGRRAQKMRGVKPKKMPGALPKTTKDAKANDADD
jgi:hypothetical protein